jgi:uncharacterized repeat protein (TIGR02543 family)
VDGSPALWVKENVIEGGTVDPLPAVTRTGYTFGDWWTGEDGDGTQFTASTPVTGNVTLYAKWTLVPTYGITLSRTASDDALDTGVYSFSLCGPGYATAPDALSVTVSNTGNQPTGNLTASADSSNFTITPSAIDSIEVSGTGAFSVEPKTGLDLGTYTATVTVSNSGNGISNSFNVSFEVVDIWADADWSPESVWGVWADDYVVADPSDPTADLTDPGAKYTAPGTWIVIQDEDITTATTLTITVSDITFTITGSATDAKNVSDQALSTTGVKLEGVSGSRRVAVTGSNPDLPLRLMLDGVTVSTNTSPIALDSGTDVIIVLAGANTLTATGNRGAGLRVRPGCTATITSVSAGTLTAQGHEYAAGIGGGADYEACGTISIGGNAQVVARGSNYGAGIGSGGNTGAGGGTVSIGGNAQVAATGGLYAAGIGGGSAGNGGTISIGGSAKVTANGGGNGAGIGGGRYQYGGGSGGTISIGGSAQVAATGNNSAGIGGGYGGSGGTISIGGNAQVAATGGGSVSAGIGGGWYGSGGTITISGGIVFARTSGGSGAGIGGGGSTRAGGKITISGGFVIAQNANSAVPDIGASEGYTGEWNDDTNSVTITGGSVYAANTNIYPAPRDASGVTPVYPLYTPATLAQKTISVTSPVVYTAKAIGKSAARFLVTGLCTASGAVQFPAEAVTGFDGLFPTAISATLWLPADTYTTGSITVDGGAGYTANVTPALVPYEVGGANRLMQ